MNDEIPSSFDALASEHTLSPRLRDLCRIFFKAGLAIGRRQSVAVASAAAQEPVGRRPGEQPLRVYHHALDRDTVPGEFR